jgi:sarcosine oxidase
MHYDVIVVGLGAMGSAAAYHLSRRGLRVLGVDQYRPPHEHGSSHGETRVIREAYFEHPVYVPLVQRAYELWEELDRVADGADLLRTTGAVMIGQAGGELMEGTLRSVRRHGLRSEPLDAASIRRRFPALRVPDTMVGIYEERGGVLDPEACITAHLREAEACGADLRFGERVAGWDETGDGVVVRTESARFRAAQLVLCMGPWLPALLPDAPLLVERQVVHWFRPAGDAAAFRPGRLPVFLFELAPDRLFYGLPEMGAGVKIARHHGGEVVPLEQIRTSVDAEDIEPVRRFAADFVPGLEPAPVRSSVCRYTNTPDGHFLIDRHPRHRRVWVVSPCSGHGFKFASVVGEIVADRVTGVAPRFDLSLFSLQRLSASG